MTDTQTPGGYVAETVELTPEVKLGYNAAGDMVKIRKLTATGGKYERDVFNPDVTDRTVVKWVTYTRYRKM